MKTQVRVLAAVVAVLTMLGAGLFAAMPGAAADTATCSDGSAADANGQCSVAPTTTTTDADVACPDGYAFSAATGNCMGPGVYTPGTPAVPAACPSELITAAAQLQAAAGGSVTASVIENGNCEIRLVKVEPQIVNCPLDAPLLAGFILNGNGACEYAADPSEAAVPAMCGGVAAPGTTAADCVDSEPVISITCADAAATLNGTSCETVSCDAGTLTGGACVYPGMAKPDYPSGEPTAAPVPPAPAPAVVVPAAGVTGPLVTTGSPSISTPVNPTIQVAAPAASAELAVTGPSNTATGLTVALSLVSLGLVALIWSDFFGRRRTEA